MFEKLKDLSIPYVIATASGIENVDFYNRTLGLDRWFKKEHIIYNDGSIRGKPFPDLFLKAMGILGIESSDVTVFEDSVAGIKAAEAARAGKIIIVDSNASDYSAWEGRYPIIKHFSEVNLDWFR